MKTETAPEAARQVRFALSSVRFPLKQIRHRSKPDRLAAGERLAVSHTNRFTPVRSFVAQGVDEHRRIGRPPRDELAFIRADRGQLLFPFVADVEDERGLRSHLQMDAV